jgi:hypothetical protein
VSVSPSAKFMALMGSLSCLSVCLSVCPLLIFSLSMLFMSYQMKVSE